MYSEFPPEKVIVLETYSTLQFTRKTALGARRPLKVRSRISQNEPGLALCPLGERFLVSKTG